MSLESPKVRSVVGRRLVTGFSLVGVTALAMCAILLMLLADVASTVRSMRDGEVTVRESLALAMAVREQYIHQAHTIIEGNHGHIGHYEKWVERVAQHASSLQERVPASERSHVEKVAASSRDLDRVFRSEIIPALDRGDASSLKLLHRETERLSSGAVQDADALALGAESRMSSWHGAAIDATRAGLVSGLGCMLLVVALSALYTTRIRRSVTRPLTELGNAANRFARGEFDHRVGKIGDGEFESLAAAFDAMLDELAERENRVVRAERLAVIGQMAAGVAHEINNPIGVIRGYLKTMSPDDPRESLAAELRILDDEAEACQRIAEDLLSYARVGELVPEPIAVDELVIETVRRYRESGEIGDRLVNVNTTQGTVVGDRGRLRQVFLNLLRNAVEASEPTQTVEVLGAPTDSGGYQVSVLDRGPGIDEADRSRVFEPFFSKRRGGSGLGLAVCHGIVLGHGGTLEVEARPGGGSVFRVNLPRESRPEHA